MLDAGALPAEDRRGPENVNRNSGGISAAWIQGCDQSGGSLESDGHLPSLRVIMGAALRQTPFAASDWCGRISDGVNHSKEAIPRHFNGKALGSFG